MTLARLKGIVWLAIPLMPAFASGNAAVASPAQSGQTVYVKGLDTPVELPVVFPPVKKIAPKPKPTEQELRTRAESGDAEAMEAYADDLSTPSDFPWYLKAAEGGSPRAMMIVANRARVGQTGSAIDLTLSDKWLNKALQMGGQALSRKDINVLKSLLDGDRYGGSGVLDAPTKAQYALAIGRAGGFKIKDIFASAIDTFPATSEKMQLLQECSNDGYPWCTLRLANDYLSGSDGLVIDHALGIKLLTRVAQAGYQFGIVVFYESPSEPGLTKTETIQLWKTAIEHGAIDYAVTLANAYRDGDGLPKNAPIAAALLQTLIERSDTDEYIKGAAIWNLASMYVDGKSLPASDQLFLTVLYSAFSSDKQTRASEADFLTTFLLYSYPPLNITEATMLLLFKSAVENSPPFNDMRDGGWSVQYHSALRLGDLYSSGQKVKQSYSDAMTWYRKAEQIATSPMGHDSKYDGTAAIKIGMLYEKGLGVPADSSTAISWYQKALEDIINNHSGVDTAALVQLLDSVQLPKESVDRAISSIRSSAEADNSTAQAELGQMYYEGKYVPQSYSEATGWFVKCGNHLSSNLGGSGMYCTETLAKMYMQGQGVMRDPAKAAFYYQRIADIGLGSSTTPPVSDILLPMYCSGEGIQMDRPKAFALLKKNIDQNLAFDELGVGAMYQMGWGVDQDLAEAFNWYRKAAADKNYSSAQAKADFTRIFRDCKGTPDNFNAAVSLYEKASGGQH